MDSKTVIEVKIWGKPVGAVALDPKYNYYAFNYQQSWLRRGVELAPRTIPVAKDNGPYVFTNLREATFQRLPGMLADALPDDFGNELVNAYMAQHGRTRESVTALDRLAYMGRRGMGALEFRPSIGSRTDTEDAVNMQTLVEGARAAVHGELSTESTTQKALNEIIRVGTSAGGARAKAVIAWNRDTGEIRSGQFEVAPGFEHWLLKFDGLGADRVWGDGRDFGKEEYAFHLMAKAAGIQMTECRLLRENGRAHFMTRRFDRDGNKKVHLQSLCAMENMDFKLVGTHSYEQAFQVVHELRIGQDAMDELFRRMAFNVMVRNCDDHTKNLAFLLREGQSWELAPAFDLTHAYNPAGPGTFQHQMGVNGKFKEIARADVLAVTERYTVRSPSRILAMIKDALDSWDQFAREAEVHENRIAAIQSQFLRL